MKKQSKFDHNKTQKDFHFIFELLFAISTNACLYIYIEIISNHWEENSRRRDFFLTSNYSGVNEFIKLSP